MATKTESSRDDLWIGGADEDGGGFNGGKLWIGRHAADGDTLVFDPEVSDPAAANVALFSLTQLRRRVFPRAVVEAKIREVTDRAQFARAEEEYRHWPELKAAREEQRVASAAETMERQRQGAVERHRRFLEERGLPYEGVRESGTGGSRRRRTKCHACGIALDDFAGSECVACGGVLCSCGACGCGAPVRAR